jgi:hypothetical protein
MIYSGYYGAALARKNAEIIFIAPFDLLPVRP